MEIKPKIESTARKFPETDATSFRARLKYQKRLFKLSRLYLQGYTQIEIGRMLNISQVRVCTLLKAAFKIWQELSREAVELRLAEELMKVNELERTYREGFERSLKPAKNKRMSEKRGPGGMVIEQTATVDEAECVGNPKWLEGVQWCIEKRLKLIGANSEGDGGMPIRDIIYKIVERSDGETDASEIGEGDADIQLSQGASGSVEEE